MRLIYMISMVKAMDQRERSPNKKNNAVDCMHPLYHIMLQRRRKIGKKGGRGGSREVCRHGEHLKMGLD